MSFISMKHLTPRERYIKELRIHQRMVNIIIEHLKEFGKEPNKVLFNALSHLAEVKELNINITLYEHYELAPKCNEMDINLLLLVKRKLRDLDVLIANLELMGG